MSCSYILPWLQSGWEWEGPKGRNEALYANDFSLRQIFVGTPSQIFTGFIILFFSSLFYLFIYWLWCLLQICDNCKDSLSSVYKGSSSG